MRLFLLSILFCTVFNIQAQKVTLISATEQSWSGGVAGHHGRNYSVTIQFNDSAAVPDTLWVGGNFYPVNTAKNDTLKRKYDRKHHTVTYNLFGYESYVDFQYGGPDPIKKKEKEASLPRPYKNYSGAALVTYQYKGTQHSFLVKTFKYLQPLDYP